MIATVLARAWVRRSVLGGALMLAGSALGYGAGQGPLLEEAGAEESSELELFDLEKLLDVEIASATKTVQTASEAPSVASVVTREQMDLYGWSTLNDVLFKQPGFFPSQDFERRTVGARGLFESWNNNHLLLLIDGVPYNDTETGGAYTWELTPLFMAKSVEIIRGPGSALYGSNATNGVVAINSYTAQDLLQRSRAHAQVRVGDFGNKRYEVFAAHAFDQFAVQVGFNHFRTFGNEYLSYDASGRTDGAGNLAQFTTRDNRVSNYMLLKVDSLKLPGLSLAFHNQSFEYETGHGWYFFVPDTGESNLESRQLATLSYRGNLGEAFTQEYVLRYGRHSIAHNLRYYGNDAFEGYYPAGVSEYIDTHFDDLFARAQLTWRPWEQATVLGGAEFSTFLYGGDNQHYSNAAITDFDGGYPPLNGPANLGPYYEWIVGHPVNNLGLYLQGASGRVFNNLVSLTAGLRFDTQFFNFTDISLAERPVTFKTFQQLSPRLAAVVHPTDSLTFKAIAGRAFRAPAPLELFGANTWAVGSNIHELQPELVTTYELAADWKVLPQLTWRTNAFHTTFENQIAYGSALVLVNYYSRVNAGAETELLFAQELPGVGQFQGFANYSFVTQLDETVQETTFEPSEALTWAPSHLAKLGVGYKRGAFSASVQGLYQGEVLRRSSDRLIPEYLSLRPDRVPAFVTLDASVSYQLLDWARLGIQATNLFDAKGQIVKGGDYAFDYQIEGRRVFATLTAQLD
ncbi:MAG: TonB-dependent receptor [Myxococcota bacterium]|nr:TonB-dependent receptor [Myxococcota bacterium]